jgi:hypothetical protein
MSLAFTAKSWPAYAVGAAIGVLSWFAFASVDRPLGVSTSFEHTAALAAQLSMPRLERTHEYFLDKRAKEKPPLIDWQWMLVVGIFLGAGLSAWLSNDHPGRQVPELWRRRFGESTAKRYLGAFFGAALMIFGARLAQGCTSGHGISGTLQLSVTSWIFAGTFFTAALITAFVLFGKERSADV